MLQIYEIFAERGEPLSLSEMARLLEVPVSSCFSLMRTLQARGYLYAVHGKKSFYPTGRWLQQARAIAERDPTIQEFRPHLERLRDAVGETVLLSKQSRNHAMVLDVVEGLHSIRFASATGDLMPLHACASGKAILGAMPRADREALIAQLKLTRDTSATITDASALLEDLELGARAGWFVTRGEIVPDVMALSTPVLVGREIFVIAIVGLIHRMDPVHQELATRMLETKRRLERGDSEVSRQM
jgi:DNA-binding IclR family transcriptional regulator